MSSDDGDSMLSPGEMWSAMATGPAENADSVVTLVADCDDAPPTHKNTGTATVPGASDSELAHYCNSDTVDTTLVAAVLPESRSVQVENPAAAFGGSSIREGGTQRGAASVQSPPSPQISHTRPLIRALTRSWVPRIRQRISRQVNRRVTSSRFPQRQRFSPPMCSWHSTEPIPTWLR